MTVRELITKLGFRVDGKGLSEFEKGIRRAKKTAKEFGAGLAGIAKTASKVGLVVGGAALALGTLAVRTAGQFESLQASLKTVTGSTEAADRAFSNIRKFASSTPFSVQEITEAFIKLKALGIEPTEENLRSFGNTSSAMGKSLSQMIEAVADASTGEFERLKEFGIKSKSEGDKVSFTFQGVTTTVGKNAQEITAFLRGIGEQNFAGAMDRQMMTLSGIISNLGDNFDAFLMSIGEGGLLDAVKEVGAEIRDMVGGSSNLATAIGQGLGEAIRMTWGLLKEFGSAFSNITAQDVRDWIMGVVDSVMALFWIVRGAISVIKGMIDTFGGFGNALGVATIAVIGLKAALGGLAGALPLAVAAAGIAILAHYEGKIEELRKTTAQLEQDLSRARGKTAEALKDYSDEELLQLRQRMKGASPETIQQIDDEIRRREDVAGGGKERREAVTAREARAAGGLAKVASRVDSRSPLGQFRDELKRQSKRLGATPAAAQEAEAAFVAAMESGANVKAARMAGLKKIRGLSGVSGKQKKEKEKTLADLLGLDKGAADLGAFNSKAENPVLGTTINRYDFSPVMHLQVDLKQRPGESAQGVADRIGDIVDKRFGIWTQRVFQHFRGATG